MTELEEGELRTRIVETAKTYLGTPYHDRGFLKGVGVDCATFAMLVMKEVGVVPADYKPPVYYPQEWMDRHKEITKYITEVNRFAVEVEEPKPGDIVLYRMVRSYAHGAIVVKWPTEILHAVKGQGVVLVDGTRDRLMQRKFHRFFSIVEKLR